MSTITTTPLGAASFIGPWEKDVRLINTVEVYLASNGNHRVSGYTLRQERGKTAIKVPFTTWTEVNDWRGKHYLKYLGSYPATGSPEILMREN